MHYLLIFTGANATFLVVFTYHIYNIYPLFQLSIGQASSNNSTTFRR
jgi:hypothetical protein